MWEKIWPNSCCGRTLQTGCKIISFIQMLIAFPLLVLTLKDFTTSFNSLEMTVSSGTFVAVQFLQMIFAGYLFAGTKERSLQNCQLWAAVTLILLAATGVFILFRLLYSHTFTALLILSILSFSLNTFFLYYGMGFIYLLKREENEGGTVYNSDI